MRKTTFYLSLLFLIINFSSFSQNNKAESKPASKLELHSVSISPIDIYFDDHTGGISLKLDFTLNKDRHIFKLQGVVNQEFKMNLLGETSSPESLYEINLLYGREFSLNKWLYYDVFGGVGFFNISNFDDKNKGNTTIGFPIQNRLRFQTKGKFGGGLQFQVNLNSLNTIYSPGIFFQLRW